MNFLGLKEDCETLLSRFQNTDSVRYEEFLSIWKELKFHTIFFGGMRNLESNRFSREALSVVSPYFLPPYTFQIRVGALYLLYGLYNTQLCEPKQKIRISLKDWPEVEKFHQDLVNAQHLDAVYIFRQMRRCRAFYFTAMPTMLTFKPQNSIPVDEGKEEFKDVRDLVSDLITGESLEEIINVHEHYQKTKRVIHGDTAEPDKSLGLIREDFSDNLNSMVSQYQHWRQENQARRVRIDDDDEKEGTSQESEGSERARFLAQIKSKSYTAVTEAVKSRRHRQVLLASSESGSDYKRSRAERRRAINLKLKEGREAEKQAYLTLTRQRKSTNMPAISEEDSSSSSEEVPVKKKRRKR